MAQADSSGETMLMKIAGADRRFDVTLGEIAVRHGVHIDAFDNGGATALTYACRRSKGAGMPTYEASNYGIFWLVKHGANVNHRENGGETPLMNCASSRDSLAAMRLLIANGARVNDRDDAGKTVLMYSVNANSSDYHFSNTPGARLLIQHGARVNERDYSDRTALIWLAYNDVDAEQSAISSAHLLIRHNADPSLRDHSGKAAYQIASENGLNHLASYLKPLTH
jgi:ankyrin repeat protein